MFKELLKMEDRTLRKLKLAECSNNTLSDTYQEANSKFRAINQRVTGNNEEENFYLLKLTTLMDDIEWARKYAGSDEEFRLREEYGME